MRGKRSRRALVIAILFAIVVTPLLTPSTRADGTATIYPNSTYTFSDATGCATTGAGGVFTDASCSVVAKLAKAYSVAIAVGYGALASARVWKAVSVAQTGSFYATMSGHWWAIVSAAGGALADVSFYFRIYNLDTGQVVTKNLFKDVWTLALWASNQQGDFSVSLGWTGTAGYHYGIEAYIEAYTAGVVGTAIADGISHGIYFTSITVASPPPTGGGGCGGCHFI